MMHTHTFKGTVVTLSLFVLFTGVLVMALPVMAEADAAPPVPVLSTGLPDYNPGDTATIFGGFFQSFQDVILKIFGGSVDDGTYVESTQTVTADASGAFTTFYTLDNVFRPLYTVVASALDGTELAETIFTDGNVKVHGAPSGTTFTLTKTTYTTTTCTGTVASGPTTVSGVGFSGGAIDTSGVGNTQSIKLVAAATSDQSGAFVNWTTSDGGMTPASPSTNATVCVVGFSGGGSRDYFANYGAPQPTTATLTLVKIVTNDNGGGALVTDWTLFAAGPTPISGTTGAGSVTTAAVNAGTYTLSEGDGPSGYTASSYSCVKNGGGAVVSNSITLASGDSATCTITNDDQPAHLILVKHLPNDNGGTAIQDDFPVFIDANTAAWGDNTVNAGSYTASETTFPGYTPSDWSNDCAADGSVTLLPGETKTCEITNDDQPAEIYGKKFEDVNGNGAWDLGEPFLSGWIINLSGPTPGSTVTNGSGEYSFTGLSAGTYTVTETPQLGWTQTTANPAPITVGLGDVVQDVNFGNFKNVSISGYKFRDDDGSTVQDNGESRLPGWTIQLLDQGSNVVATAVTDVNGNYTFSNVGPGTYTIQEVMESGWTQTAPVSGIYTVTVQSGQNLTDEYFGNLPEHEGTVGLWKNWNKHNKYTQAQINTWLAAINTSSAWLMSEAGYSPDTTGMVNLINDGTKNCDNAVNKDLCAKRKFLMQYMVNHLNVASGRKSLSSTYNLSGFSSAMSYLGISPTTAVTLGQFITKVEVKAPAMSNRNQYLQVMSVSDYINNQGI